MYLSQSITIILGFVPDEDYCGRNVVRCRYLLRERSSTQLRYTHNLSMVITAQDPSEAWSSYPCIQLTPAYPLLLVNTVPTDKLVLYIKCLSDALQHLLTPTVVWGVVCCQAPLAGGLHDCTSEKEGKKSSCMHSAAAQYMVCRMVSKFHLCSMHIYSKCVYRHM